MRLAIGSNAASVWWVNGPHDTLPSDASGNIPRNYQTIGNTDREKSYFLNMYLRRRSRHVWRRGRERSPHTHGRWHRLDAGHDHLYGPASASTFALPYLRLKAKHLIHGGIIGATVDRVEHADRMSRFKVQTVALGKVRKSTTGNTGHVIRSFNATGKIPVPTAAPESYSDPSVSGRVKNVVHA